MPRATKAETPATAGPRLVTKSGPKAAVTKSKSTKPTPSPDSLQDLITKRAYELFLQEGGVHGRDIEHWLQAEQEMNVAMSPVKKTPSTKTAS